LRGYNASFTLRGYDASLSIVIKLKADVVCGHHGVFVSVNKVLQKRRIFFRYLLSRKLSGPS
jgi:hypothetical protein